MRLHRFIGDFNLSKKELKITNPENIKQIKGVLRLEIGNRIILGDGKGGVAEATILDMSPKSISVGMEKIIHLEETETKVSLYLAILKKENFELAVQKAVETGVSNITPIITERTVKTGLNTERLIKIIREASEQSGRSVVPTLSPILKFEDALKNNPEAEEKTIFHLGGESYSQNKNVKTVNIFIGPEGGFTEAEVALAKKAGYRVASLGSLTLRGETAAIVATYRAVNRI
ncbi:MAG: RsmE family RNA methyltransferase [Minisyncoccia bacterium]